MTEGPRYSADEFERESRYIDNLIWDALAIEPSQRVVFCGFGEDGRWIQRAVEAGVAVSVIEHREEVIRRFDGCGASVLHGSTSLIPAANDAFDLAIAFHYLHEADPFFHAQILSELARTSKRIAIVEPGPPADALGKRIARLYSQAKRELGQFEYYQPLEYWRKLVQSVKADVSQHVFAFAKIPPREYLQDTIALLLDTMKAEEAPQAELEELRAIARRSDALLLPPSRFVVAGAAVGDLPQPIFTPREQPSPTPALARAAQGATPVPEPPRRIAPETGYEFPPVPPPAAPVPPPAAPGVAPQPPPVPAASPIAPPAPPLVPGAAPAPSLMPEMPFGGPFAVPGAEGGIQPPFGVPPVPGAAPPWQWEPPEGDGPPKP